MQKASFALISKVIIMPSTSTTVHEIIHTSSPSQVSLARFQFDYEEVFNDEDVSVEDWYDEVVRNATDSTGTEWQMMFQNDVDDDSVRFYVSLISCLCEKYGEDPYTITAQVSLVVRNELGDALYEFKIPARGYHSYEFDDSYWHDFAKWSALKDMFIGRGTLVVDAIIQYHQHVKEFHVPSNPFVQNMLKLLDSGEDADVYFKVEDEVIGAHRLVLKANSTVLANYCGSSNNNESTSIIIKDTKPHVFRYVLHFIYGGNTPTDEEMVQHGKEIIDACDRYDVVGLKIATETALVCSCIIDVNNVADWLQYADAKTCPLLKEYALSYFAVRARDVFKTESYKSNMRDSPKLMEEIIMVVQTSSEDSRFGASHNMRMRLGASVASNMLSVDKLRASLDRLGLDVDGSREMLVSRLDNSMKK